MAPSSNRFREDCDILTNEIRGFTVGLLKFFIENKSCDWPIVYRELENMNGEIQKILVKINKSEENNEQKLSRSWVPDENEFTEYSKNRDEFSLADEIEKNSEVLKDVHKRLEHIERLTHTVEESKLANESKSSYKEDSSQNPLDALEILKNMQFSSASIENSGLFLF